MRVSVIGLGKLGAPLAAVLASKGNEVLGVDVNPEAVSLLNDGRAPVAEPGLQELIDEARDNLGATKGLEEAADADLSIVLVPTPSDESGAFSNTHVLATVEGLGRGLSRRDGYHVVVIGSTVMPGSCESAIRSVLESASGRRVGESLGLCYSPEFIALGSVIRDMLRPDMVLIGESDPRAGDVLEALYAGVCENDPPFRRMALVNAELTKIAVNAYVTMKISFANTLADLCERLPGADVEIVTDALGLDSRIGHKYLRGAVAYGGPCFPRDTKAFSALARNVDAEAPLAEATESVNVAQIDRLARAVRSRISSGEAVGILGLTYKPATAVIDESPGLAVARMLAEEGHDVYVYDPEGTPQAMHELAGLVQACESVSEVLDRCDVVVIATPWPEFAEIGSRRLRGRRDRLTVVDCWRMLADDLQTDLVEVVHLGRGVEESIPGLTVVGGTVHGR